MKNNNSELKEAVYRMYIATDELMRVIYTLEDLNLIEAEKKQKWIDKIKTLEVRINYIKKIGIKISKNAKDNF